MVTSSKPPEWLWWLFFWFGFGPPKVQIQVFMFFLGWLWVWRGHNARPRPGPVRCPTPGGSGWGGSNAAMKQTSPLHCSGFPPRLEGVCGWEQSCYNSKLSRQHSCGFPPTRALWQANWRAVTAQCGKLVLFWFGFTPQSWSSWLGTLLSGLLKSWMGTSWTCHMLMESACQP